MEMDSDEEHRMDVESDDDVDDIDVSVKNLVAGKIISVHLKNFLTHTEATVYPNEQLNLVSCN